MVLNLEEEADHSEGLLILMEVRAIDELVNDVNLQIVLLVVYAVLSWAVHVHMVHLVLVGSLSVQVSNLNTAKVSSL